MADATVYRPTLLGRLTRKAEFRFSSRDSAIGMTAAKDRTYLISSDRSNVITTLYGELRGPASGKPPARRGLGSGVYVLKVEHRDEIRFYRFFRLKPKEGAAVLAELNKGRSEHVDSIGR